MSSADRLIGVDKQAIAGREKAATVVKNLIYGRMHP